MPLLYIMDLWCFYSEEKGKKVGGGERAMLSNIPLTHSVAFGPKVF